MSLTSARWTTRRRTMWMVEASLAACAISGAFLTLGDFDLFYHLVSFVVLLKHLARQERRALEEPVAVPPLVAERDAVPQGAPA